MSARADMPVETLGAKDYRERVKRRQAMLAGLDCRGLKREIFAARAATIRSAGWEAEPSGTRDRRRRHRRHALRVQFEQADCLDFPREQCSLGVGEPDTLAAQPISEQPILGLSFCRYSAALAPMADRQEVELRAPARGWPPPERRHRPSAR
jgi:hypothetical protein